MSTTEIEKKLPEITYFQPSCGPMAGGIILYIYGNNFPPNKSIRVKFQHENTIKYATAKSENDYRMVCELPPFDYECDATIEAFVEGYYTYNQHIFHYFPEFYVTNVIPPAISETFERDLEISIMCDNWRRMLTEEQKQWKDIPNISLKPDIDSARDAQVIFRVKFQFETGEEVINPAEQKRTKNDKIVLTCKPPLEYTGKCFITITMNGFLYSQHKENTMDSLVIYDEPIFRRITPGCKPIDGYNDFKLTGINIFKSTHIIIGFYIDDKEIFNTIGRRTDENTIKFTLGQLKRDGIYDVKISMNNGDSYSKQILQFIVYYPPIIERIFPEYGVAQGNTAMKIKLLLNESDINNKGELIKREIQNTHFHDTDDIKVKFVVNTTSKDKDGRMISVNKTVGISPAKLNDNGELELKTPSNLALLTFQYAKIEETQVYVALNTDTFVSIGINVFRYFIAPPIVNCSIKNLPSSGNIPFSILLKDTVIETNEYYIRFQMNGETFIQEAWRYQDLEDPDASYELECKLPKLENCPVNGTEAIVDFSYNNLDFSFDTGSFIKVNIYFVPDLLGIFPEWGYLVGNDRIELIFNNTESFVEQLIEQNKKISVKWSWRSERFADVQLVTPVEIIDHHFYTITPSCHSDSQQARLDVGFGENDFCETNIFYKYYQIPKCDNIFPTSGPLTGGTEISIFGKGFIETNAIKVRVFTYCDEEFILDVQFISLREIRCVMPAMKQPGYVTVSVSLNGQQFYMIKPLLFFYYKPPFSISCIPQYAMNFSVSTINLVANDIIFPGESDIKIVHESGIEEIVPTQPTQLFNWNIYCDSFYTSVGNDYSNSNIRVCLKELWDIIQEQMTLLSCDNNILINTPNTLPPGKIRLYISIDNKQHFSLCDTYLTIVGNPVIKKMKPSAFHFTGSEVISIIGGNLKDMGKVSILLTSPSPNTHSLLTHGIVKSGIVQFKTPRFNELGSWQFRLSLDGHYFTEPKYTDVYGPLTLESIDPKFGLITGDTKVYVKGSGLVNTGMCVVRLVIKDSQFEPVIVPGKFENGFIVFTTSQFPCSGKAIVEVSLNGRNWDCNYINGKESCEFLIYDLPVVYELELTGPFNDVVKVRGANFYSEIIPIVRFIPQDGEKKGELIDVEAKLISDTELECKSPSIFTEQCIIEVTMDKEHYTTNGKSILFKVLPIVTEIIPLWGPLCGGTVMTLKGENFADTGRIIISFNSPWSGDRRVFGSYMKDGTIQCNVPSFIDCKNKTKEFKVTVDVCLYGGSTLYQIDPLYPLKEYNLYKEIPLVWNVAPRDGPLYGKFLLTIETKNVEFTHDLHVRLLHQTSLEEFSFVPDYLGDSKLQIKFPAFKKSSDGIVSVYVTYNDQDYSPDHPRAAIEVWSSWIKKSGKKKARRNRIKKKGEESELDKLKNMKAGIAKRYLEQKIIKESKGEEEEPEDLGENPLWIAPDSAFRLPDIKDLKLESLDVNSKIQHLNKGDLQIAIENELAPIWVQRDAYYAPYLTASNDPSLFEGREEIEKYYPSNPSDEDLKIVEEGVEDGIDKNRKFKIPDIMNNKSPLSDSPTRAESELDNYRFGTIHEDEDEDDDDNENVNKRSRLNTSSSVATYKSDDDSDFSNNNMSTRNSMLQSKPRMSVTESPYVKYTKSFTMPKNKRKSFMKPTPPESHSAYGAEPKPPKHPLRQSKVYSGRRSGKVEEVKEKEEFVVTERTQIRRNMDSLVSDIILIPDLMKSIGSLFHRYDRNNLKYVEYGTYDLIMSSIFPELSDNDKSGFFIKWCSNDKFYYEDFLKEINKTINEMNSEDNSPKSRSASSSMRNSVSFSPPRSPAK